ncbi:unnamed protein product [Larinioides sclopetarius]|uniref:Topoisomerase I C-terminal domain-containing protein n=1 Tax=Larinioides sclopetarius TaxID=280406 RepID=A0AAV1ZY92_9ARAC
MIVIDAKGREITTLEKEAKDVKLISEKEYQKKIRALMTAKDRVDKLSLKALDKRESRGLDILTSKANYIDPRITVACVKDNPDLAWFRVKHCLGCCSREFFQKPFGTVIRCQGQSNSFSPNITITANGTCLHKWRIVGGTRDLTRSRVEIDIEILS